MSMYESPFRETLMSIQPFMLGRPVSEKEHDRLASEYHRLKQLDLEAFYNTLNAFDWFFSMTEDTKVRQRGQQNLAYLKVWASTSDAHMDLFEAFRRHVFGSNGYGDNPGPKPRHPDGYDFRPGDTLEVTEADWSYPKGTLFKVMRFDRGDRGKLWVTRGQSGAEMTVDPNRVKLVVRAEDHVTFDVGDRVRVTEPKGLLRPHHDLIVRRVEPGKVYVSWSGGSDLVGVSPELLETVERVGES